MPSDETPETGLGTALKRLGLALLNATLMLVALVLVLAVVLAVQVRGIVHDGRAELRAEVARLELQVSETRATAAQALAALEARREAARPSRGDSPGDSPGAIRPGADALPPDLAALHAALSELAERLASLELAPPDPAARNLDRLDDETFMRRLVLAFIRAVAREILAPEAPRPVGTGHAD